MHPLKVAEPAPEVLTPLGLLAIKMCLWETLVRLALQRVSSSPGHFGRFPTQHSLFARRSPAVLLNHAALANDAMTGNQIGNIVGADGATHSACRARLT